MLASIIIFFQQCSSDKFINDKCCLFSSQTHCSRQKIGFQASANNVIFFAAFCLFPPKNEHVLEKEKRIQFSGKSLKFSWAEIALQNNVATQLYLLLKTVVQNSKYKWHLALWKLSYKTSSLTLITIELVSQLTLNIVWTLGLDIYSDFEVNEALLTSREGWQTELSYYPFPSVTLYYPSSLIIHSEMSFHLVSG